MNAHAQTAAVIDFQKPLNLSTDRKRFKIHVAPNITEMQEFKLRLRFNEYLGMFQHYQGLVEKAGDDVIQKYRYLEQADGYKTAAMALIDSLHILHAIEEKEYRRLGALFSEQADLFDDIQAA